jgi:hypothetical protein
MRRPEVIYNDISAIMKNLGMFDLPTLADMARINKFEASDVGSSGEGPKPKHSISDPTGSHVVQKLSGRKIPDPVGSASREVDRAIFEIRRKTEVLIQQLAYIQNPRDRLREMMVANCEACLRVVACTSSDRLRSGFCYQDYRKWLSLGKPNRTQFIAQIQADQEAA